MLVYLVVLVIEQEKNIFFYFVVFNLQPNYLFNFIQSNFSCAGQSRTLLMIIHTTDNNYPPWLVILLLFCSKART